MNKIVLVTGAGRGLGYNIALRHLSLGDRVYAYDYQITDELRQRSEESDLLSISKCDIGSTASVQEATKDVLAAGKKIDIVYNVAGIFRFEDKVGLAETDLDLCANMYNINAVGALRICKAVLSLLEAGSIVINISSEAGSIGNCQREQEYSYCMSKAALNMGMKIFANAVNKSQIRIMNLHPGWLRTAMGGPGAMASSNSISPYDSAEHIVQIALDMDQIPEDIMYMEHTREPLPW